MHPHVHCSIIYSSQDMETISVPVSQSANDQISLPVEYHPTMKTSETLTTATAWMGLEGIVLHKISQRKKHTYPVISLICGILKEQTHRYGERIGGCQGRGWGLVLKWMKGVKRSKLQL